MDRLGTFLMRMSHVLSHRGFTLKLAEKTPKSRQNQTSCATSAKSAGTQAESATTSLMRVGPLGTGLQEQVSQTTPGCREGPTSPVGPDCVPAWSRSDQRRRTNVVMPSRSETVTA